MSGRSARGELESLNEALGRLTRLERQLFVGWAAFWILLATALLWGVVTLGIHPDWGGHAVLWLAVPTALSLGVAGRTRLRGEWPEAGGVARRIDEARRLDNVVVSAWILHGRPELCASEVIRDALSGQALPVAREFELAFDGPGRRRRMAAALALLLLVLVLFWLFRPRAEAPAAPGAQEAEVPQGAPPDPEEPGPTVSSAEVSETSGDPASGNPATEPTGGSETAEALEGAREVAGRLEELAREYSRIAKAREIEAPRKALEQALQDPSPERIREAAEALEQASESAEKSHSATSTEYSQETGRDVSRQLGQMAEKLRESQAQGEGQGQGQGQDQGQGQGQDQGQGQGSSSESGKGGGGVGGREAGTGGGGDHHGGSAPANETPQESKNKLTPRMPGERKLPDKAPQPDRGDTGRSPEQDLAEPNDPDIVLDQDFERRLEALRAAGRDREGKKESKDGTH